MTLTPEQKSEGWIEWSGGKEGPIKDDRTVFEWGPSPDSPIAQTTRRGFAWGGGHKQFAYRIIEAHGADAEPARPAEASETDYQLGYRDGYETAVQECDILSGGDGEYFASTLGSDCRTPDQMKRRMAERWQAQHSCPTPYPNGYDDLIFTDDGWSQTIIVDGKRPEWLRDDDGIAAVKRKDDRSGHWNDALWENELAIRVRRREPKRETVKCRLLFSNGSPFNDHRNGTIELIDGKPDLSTLKIEEQL